MSKRFTKIICLNVAVIAALGVTVASGCGGYYGAKSLPGDISGTISSNGGFAVEKGDYVYFINGVEGNEAENGYGKPVKGAIYRISSKDLSEHNYASVDCVVPLVSYTADYNAGLFIYGDYIYYGTPSTDKNSDGEVLNDKLDMKSSKLDGTQTMKDAYVQFPSNEYEYRFVQVEEDGPVYLLYVATDEKVFEESTAVKNLHSYNTATGVDTLLAYNVDTVVFDETDKTNSRVYYTMNVKNYGVGSNFGYNQVYTVKADATKDNFADKNLAELIEGWNDDEDDDARDRYINCGDLVFDGIGLPDFIKNHNEGTPFNYDATGEVRNDLSLTYELVTYQGGSLFYTRTSSNNDGQYLFSIKDSDITKDNPVTRNADSDNAILSDGSAAGDYKYIFNTDGSLKQVIIEEEDGITVNKCVGGKLQTKPIGGDNYYYIVRSTATVLFLDGSYLYYSVTGGNGYTFNRIDYTSENKDVYGRMPENDDVNEYTSVKLLDLDANTEWYMPEIINGQLLFASETDSMTNFNYVMAFDLRKDRTDTLMSNAEISALNKQYEGITDIFNKYADTDKYDEKNYANLTGALKYAFYTGDEEYIKELAVLCNEAAKKADENADDVYSDKTLALVADFIAAKNDWKEYNATAKVNGKDVYANRRDYYYGVLGEMTESDAEGYVDALKAEHLQSEPQDDSTWWESLSTGAKAGFIIGMCACGIVVIGGATWLTIFLIRRKKNKMPTYKKKIKVDTTDDKDIDVYSEE